MNIFILTGSGVSADSGLRTFRDEENGIWMGECIKDVACSDSFETNPELFNKFYNGLREAVDEHAPNPAHYAIADYINKTKNNVMLVTQNVDNYHEIASGGKHKVRKMHGSLYKMVCVKCGNCYEVGSGYCHQMTSACEDCGEVGSIRTNIVCFGENVHYQEEINKFLYKDECGNRLDYFIAIGTSGVVYPAAGFVKRAHFNSTKVYINLDMKDASHIYKHKITGRAAETVPVFFEKLFNEHG